MPGDRDESILSYTRVSNLDLHLFPFQPIYTETPAVDQITDNLCKRVGLRLLVDSIFYLILNFCLYWTVNNEEADGKQLLKGRRFPHIKGERH